MTQDMTLYQKIKNRQEKIAIVGLGYVGLPLAISLAKKAEVIGFDINRQRIEKYKAGIDITNEVGNEALKKTTCMFTDDESALKDAKFIIVAVPTPIAVDKTPDLYPVEAASRTVGRNLTYGAIVVYESTVYPGVTEDICIPILEMESGLKCGVEFKLGYSPERINPGDKEHRLENITKIVSGIDEESLDEIAAVYEMVVEAGVHRASSIKVAEAAKVVENSQRDINIAFMNELAIVFNKMGIDTHEVIKAMNTKWNALRFYPGLVGGHCIGVDPYYFIYKAEQLGYHSQIILSGRKINDDMGRFVGENIIKKLILADKKVKGAKVLVLGITFKENCSDVRNSKVIDILNTLKEYGVDLIVCDPIANIEETLKEYNIELVELKDVPKVDCVVCAVKHDVFQFLKVEELVNLYTSGQGVLVDVKSIFNKKDIDRYDIIYWNL